MARQKSHEFRMGYIEGFRRAETLLRELLSNMGEEKVLVLELGKPLQTSSELRRRRIQSYRKEIWKKLKRKRK